MEIVDIVDENNKVIGQIAKGEAHQTGALHRCVVSQLIDSQGNWTLVKQASDRQDAGQYVSPVGGHVQAGESEDDALKREAFEELGLKNFKFKLIGRKIFNREVIGRKENHYFIVYEIYSDQPPVLNHESVGYEKFTPEQLAQEIKENPTKFGNAFHFGYSNFYQTA